MRLWLAITALLVATAALLSAVAQSTASSKALVPGDYLRLDYIQKLGTTQSPLAASTFDEAQLVQVRKDQNELVLLTVLNFHEGGAEFILQRDGSARTKLAAGYDVTNLVLKVSDSHHFALGFDRFKPMPYVFVGDAEQYVRTSVLSGKYADGNGREYVFGADGWAVFPDHKFQYRVGIDHIPNMYDYFEDKTSNKTYAFKKQFDLLEIFPTSGEASQNVTEKPILSLRRSSSER